MPDQRDPALYDTEIAAAYPSPLMHHGIVGSNFTAERVNIHDVVDPVKDAPDVSRVRSPESRAAT